MDGTLLDSAHQLPQKNSQTVCAAVERGVEVAIVTGRRFDFAMLIAQQIPCPLTMIVNNGALIKNKARETYLRKLLPAATAHKVIASAPAHRAAAMVMFDRERSNQVILETIDWNDPKRKGYFERNREYLAEVSPLENCLTEDPIQVMYAGGVEAMRDLHRTLAAQDWAGEYSTALTEYQDRNFSLVDIVDAGVSKGTALREWAAQKSYPQEAVMAIGDNWNDKEMLDFAGVPVIMGNAVAGLKQFGWHETGSNDDFGAAAAIERFVLNGRG